MMARRVLDIVLVLPLFPPLLAILPFMWVAGRLGGYPGLFFRQERVGFLEEPIRLWKFCSLKERDGGMCAGPLHSLLRRIGVDELPQAIHVLKGEMSCVGPRPLVAEDLFRSSADSRAERERKIETRQSVLPGMTGVSQVSNRNREGNGQNGGTLLDQDLWYVRHRSFRLDCLLLLVTPLYVLSIGKIRFPAARSRNEDSREIDGDAAVSTTN